MTPKLCQARPSTRPRILSRGDTRKPLLAILSALLVTLALAVPAFAASGTVTINNVGSYTFADGDDRQVETTPTRSTGGDIATLTFQLSLGGEVPRGEIFVLEYPYPSGQSFGDYVFCGSVDTGMCVGGGTVYTVSVEAASGSSEKFAFGRLPRGGSVKIFHEGIVVSDDGNTISAHYNFQGDKQTEDTVTKTFKLTLRGDRHGGQAFAVKYGPRIEGETSVLVFCGEPVGLENFPGYKAKGECIGDGSVYTESVELPAGSTIFSVFVRYSDGSDYTTEEAFHEGNQGETLNNNVTNAAWYRFGSTDNQQGATEKQSGQTD